MCLRRPGGRAGGRFDVRSVKGNATTEQSPKRRRRRRRSAVKVNGKGAAENWKSCLADRPTEGTDLEIGNSLGFLLLINFRSIEFFPNISETAALSTEPFVRGPEPGPALKTLLRSAAPLTQSPFRPNFHGPTIKAVTQTVYKALTNQLASPLRRRPATAPITFLRMGFSPAAAVPILPREEEDGAG